MELHEVKPYPGKMLDDAASVMDDLPEGCKDIGQIQGSAEIMRDTMQDFNRIFGVGK